MPINPLFGLPENRDKLGALGSFGMGAAFLPELEKALEIVQAQEAPTPGPPPQVAGPFGSFAAAVTSSLAEQMGARGAVAANQQRVEADRAERARYEQRQLAASAEFDRRKTGQTLEILSQMADTKFKMAQEIGDAKAAEQALKDKLAYGKQLHTWKMEQIGRTQELMGQRQMANLEKRAETALKLEDVRGNYRKAAQERLGNTPESKKLLAQLDKQADARWAVIQRFIDIDENRMRGFPPQDPIYEEVVANMVAEYIPWVQSLYERGGVAAKEVAKALDAPVPTEIVNPADFD